MSRRGWRLAAAIGLAVSVGVALTAAGLMSRAARRADIPVETVEPSAFVRVVPAEGSLQASRATPVSVPTGATAPLPVGWLAEDGSRVRAGEVIARFDPSEIEKELEEAADQLAGARLKAEKERVHGLAEVRKLEEDLALARKELNAAQQFQKKDGIVYSRAEIVESEIDQDLARERESHARQARRGQESLTGAGLDLLGIEMRQAEARIQRARASLASLQVTAPHDGVLVLQRDWNGEPIRVGDMVWNGQVLAEIPALETMEAEVFVLEADAGGLSPGKPATVILESRPGVEHAARIARVDSLARPRFRGSPVQYFGITLALDRTDPATMKPGQRVRAILRLDERAGALTVPRQAVFERDGSPVVYRRKVDAGAFETVFEAVFEAVTVKLGPSGAGRVVVESGLSRGDVVALADPTRRDSPGSPESPDETPDPSGETAREASAP